VKAQGGFTFSPFTSSSAVFDGRNLDKAGSTFSSSTGSDRRSTPLGFSAATNWPSISSSCTNTAGSSIPENTVSYEPLANATKNQEEERERERKTERRRRRRKKKKEEKKEKEKKKRKKLKKKKKKKIKR